MKKTWMAATLVLALSGCVVVGGYFGPAPKDGELAMPNGYKGWPGFLMGIEKPTGHIRDIYISPEGTSAKKGEAFANGTRFVMEIYKGNKGADGKLVKGDLEQIYVMYKGKNWGSTAPENLKTGDWVYSAFDAKGQPNKEAPYAACRGCHVPLGDKDYVFHYDQYFDKKKAAGHGQANVVAAAQ